MCDKRISTNRALYGERFILAEARYLNTDRFRTVQHTEYKIESTARGTKIISYFTSDLSVRRFICTKSKPPASTAAKIQNIPA
jgi:hypothetical protein